MTIKDEALRMAMEALEEISSQYMSLTKKGCMALAAIKEALAEPEQEPCGGCNGSGRVTRDPDIGTDQECFVCDGTGKHKEQK